MNCDKRALPLTRTITTDALKCERAFLCVPTTSAGEIEERMDTAPFRPSYYFTVEDLNAAHSDEERFQRLWQPPRRLGFNIKTPATSMFYNNGTSTIHGSRESLPLGLDLHDTFSLYQARGVLWFVEYDASEKQVGDGSHSRDEESQDGGDSSDTEDCDDPNYDDWTELSFDQLGPTDPGGYLMSIAGRRLAKTKLVRCRANQYWAPHFVTDRYRSEVPAQGQNEGGLAGKVALLIGLVAMSMEPENWSTYIPQTVAAPRAHPGQWHVSLAQMRDNPHGAMRRDKRGLVVSVYLDPDGTSKQNLQQYERGEWGPILG